MLEHSLHIERIKGDGDSFNAELLEHIKRYNNQVSPDHLAKRDPANLTPIRLKALINGEFAGGIGAIAYWDCLEIDNLFIEARFRKHGVGTALLAQAEALAKEAGARYAFLRTFSYMAPKFYEKHGFYVIGELKDHPPGHSFLWYRRDFA